MLNLYYLPGACSLVPHVALEWTGAEYQAVEVPRDSLQSPEFLALNPRGSVPVLQDGDWALSQNVAIVEYLNECYPEARLFGSGDAKSRARARQWLAYVNSDVHKAFGPLFAPQRFIDDEDEQAKLRAVAAGRVTTLYEWPAQVLAEQPFLSGDELTIADVYLYVTLRWAFALGLDLSFYPAIDGFMNRVEENDGVQAALRQQGLM